MSADFPIPLMCYTIPEEEPTKEITIEENKPKTIALNDGRKIHLLIENPATKKQEPVPLTEDQKQTRMFLGVCVFFLILAIGLICTLLDSI